MSFMEPMIMTASTNKKLRKKKRRKNEIFVFAFVLLAVLTIGSIALAFAAVKKGQQADDGTRETEIETADERAQEVEKESISEKISKDGLWSDKPSEPMEEPENVPTGRYDALLQDAEAMRAQNVYAKEAASPEEIVLAFAGDILFDPQYAVMANLIQRGGNIEEAFSEDILEIMHVRCVSGE